MHELLRKSVVDKAARLREVRKDLLRQEPGATQRWFQGPDGCDLWELELDPRPSGETMELARALLENAAVDELTLALVRKQLGLR